MSASPTVHLIDALYWIFRAYHALPDLRAPDPAHGERGRPVGALRGYASSLIKWLREQQPTHVAVAWDFAFTSFRNELYPDYKHGRTEPPEDLEPQLGPCKQLTRALGIPVFEREGYEADDVIATLVGRLSREAPGPQLWIWSRDKDLGALVSPSVMLVDPQSGTRSGPAQISHRLGVLPEQVPDYLTLVGDAVDGIPGVAGIGSRTARVLLGAFGSISAIPESAEDWPDLGLRGPRSIARKLAAGRDSLRLSRELVRMRDDLPLEASLAVLAYAGARRDALAPLLRENGAESLLERVPRFAEDAPPTAPARAES